MEQSNFKKKVIHKRTELLKGNNKKTLMFKNSVIKKLIAKLGL